jgi:hypothetical protein
MAYKILAVVDEKNDMARLPSISSTVDYRRLVRRLDSDTGVRLGNAGLARIKSLGRLAQISRSMNG